MDASCHRSRCRLATGPALAVAACALLFAGCLGSRGRSESLQAALREQGQQITDLNRELDKSKNEVQLAQQELGQLREQLAKRGGATGTYPIRLSGIQVIPMMSSAADQNGDEAEDAVTVTFSPVDADGEVVKLPGDIEIALLEPDTGDKSRTLSSKEYSLEECRGHWVRSFLGSGYQFTVPYQKLPEKSDIVVHVHMKTADGRTYEATHLVKVAPKSDIVQTGAKKNSSASNKKVEANRPDFDRHVSSEDDSKTSDVHSAKKPPRKEIRESTNWTEETIPVYR